MLVCWYAGMPLCWYATEHHFEVRMHKSILKIVNYTYQNTLLQQILEKHKFFFVEKHGFCNVPYGLGVDYPSSIFKIV